MKTQEAPTTKASIGAIEALPVLDTGKYLSQYKGNPVISLPWRDDFAGIHAAQRGEGWKFGLKKAQLMVEHYQAIKEFAWYGTTDKVEVSQFQGRPCIIIPDGTDFGFRFGENKAALVVRYIKTIRQFCQINPAVTGTHGMKPAAGPRVDWDTIATHIIEMPKQEYDALMAKIAEARGEAAAPAVSAPIKKPTTFLMLPAPGQSSYVGVCAHD